MAMNHAEGLGGLAEHVRQVLDSVHTVVQFDRLGFVLLGFQSRYALHGPQQHGDARFGQRRRQDTAGTVRPQGNYQEVDPFAVQIAAGRFHLLRNTDGKTTVDVESGVSKPVGNLRAQTLQSLVDVGPEPMIEIGHGQQEANPQWVRLRCHLCTSLASIGS